MDERLLMFVNLVVVDAVSVFIDRQYQTASGEGVGVAEQSLIKQNISEHDFPQDLTRRGPWPSVFSVPPAVELRFRQLLGAAWRETLSFLVLA